MIGRTVDIDKINSVLKHPDIWPNIADDDDNIDEFNPPMGDYHYLFDEGVLCILHPDGDDWEMHVNVVQDYRAKALEAASEAFRYGFEEIGANRIVANIPVKYGNVYGFALKFMKDKGIDDGIHRLALEAEEWAL